MMELKRFTVNGDYRTADYRDDRRHVKYTAAPRGGCLWLGQITVTDLSNGRRFSFSSTMALRDEADASSPTMLAYVSSIWDKHLAKQP